VSKETLNDQQCAELDKWIDPVLVEAVKALKNK
jgi:hypothetical protein